MLVFQPNIRLYKFTKIFIISTNLKKVLAKSYPHKKMSKSAIKSSFPQSYPHYPRYMLGIVWITFFEKRTNVLLRYDKNAFFEKKKQKKLDF